MKKNITDLSETDKHSNAEENEVNLKNLKKDSTRRSINYQNCFISK